MAEIKAGDEKKSISIVNPGNKYYPFQRKVVFRDSEKKAAVENDFELIYDSWSKNSNLTSQLRQWLADSEGISDPVSFPWEGASDIVKPVIETRQNIIHSFYMSVIRPNVGRLFVCVTENKASDEEKELARKMTDFFNSNHDFNRMFVASTNEAFWAVLRDGTVGRVCDWLRLPETRWEVKTYDNVADFVQDFPTPEDAGLTPERFAELINGINFGEPITLDSEWEEVRVDRPDIDTAELKDLIIYPITVSRQERARFVGVRFYRRASELKQMEKYGVYNGVDEVIGHDPEAKTDDISQLQNEIDGVEEGVKNEDYLCVQGRYLFDLNGDGVEEKYLTTFCPQAKKFIQFDKYPFYHNEDYIKISWFKRRVKRMLGRGVAQMLSDSQKESTAGARQRINSRSITDQPMLEIVETLKVSLDPRRPENKFRPGGVWWTPAALFGKAVRQIEIAKRDFGDSINEESLIASGADNLTGASELRSGRETQHDPRAPAAKTAMLLQQSSIRLDDFVYDFIMKENEALDVAKKLYYQYGPEKITFIGEGVDGQPGEEIELPKPAFANDNIHLQLVVTSLMDNPDFLKQRWEDFYMKYAPEPLLGAVPQVRHTILKQIISNIPEANGVPLLLPLEQIQQMSPPVPMEGGNPAQAFGAGMPTKATATGVQSNLKTLLGGVR